MRKLREELFYWQGQARLDARSLRLTREKIRMIGKCMREEQAACRQKRSR